MIIIIQSPNTEGTGSVLGAVEGEHHQVASLLRQHARLNGPIRNRAQLGMFTVANKLKVVQAVVLNTGDE